MISPIYAKSDKKIIVYDLNPKFKLHYLGLWLPKEKILINKSDLGNGLGAFAKGLVINEGTTGDNFCKSSNSSCVGVNYGLMELKAGDSADGLIVDCGKRGPVKGSARAGLLLDFNTDYAGSPQLGYGRNVVSFGVVYAHTIVDFGNEYVGTCDHPEGTLSIRKPLNFSDPRPNGAVVKESDCAKIPGLLEYVDTLRLLFESGKGDNCKAVELVKSLGDIPALTIETEIRRILKNAKFSCTYELIDIHSYLDAIPRKKTVRF